MIPGQRRSPARPAANAAAVVTATTTATSIHTDAYNAAVAAAATTTATARIQRPREAMWHLSHAEDKVLPSVRGCVFACQLQRARLGLVVASEPNLLKSSSNPIVLTAVGLIDASLGESSALDASRHPRHPAAPPPDHRAASPFSSWSWHFSLPLFSLVPFPLLTMFVPGVSKPPNPHGFSVLQVPHHQRPRL